MKKKDQDSGVQSDGRKEYFLAKKIGSKYGYSRNCMYSIQQTGILLFEFDCCKMTLLYVGIRSRVFHEFGPVPWKFLLIVFGYLNDESTSLCGWIILLLIKRLYV